MEPLHELEVVLEKRRGRDERVGDMKLKGRYTQKGEFVRCDN